jgi:hypothetical protein
MADRIVDGATGVSIREMAGQSGSLSITTDTFERSFLCKGTTDPLVARQAIINQRVPLDLDEFAGLNLSTLAWSLFARDDSWKFVAAYSFTPSPGNYTINMDSSGGTVNVAEAFDQLRYDAPGQTGGDFETSINVDRQGNPKGVDKVIPALKLSISARLTAGITTDPLAYSKIVTNVTGYTNLTEYLTFQPGELLFLGATGEIVGETPLLTYTFAASPNLPNLTVGSIINIVKGGHQYIWTTYLTQKDPLSDLNVEIATAAYVATIYGAAEMSGLGIGV